MLTCWFCNTTTKIVLICIESLKAYILRCQPSSHILCETVLWWWNKLQRTIQTWNTWHLHICEIAFAFAHKTHAHVKIVFCCSNNTFAQNFASSPWFPQICAQMPKKQRTGWKILETNISGQECNQFAPVIYFSVLSLQVSCKNFLRTISVWWQTRQVHMWVFLSYHPHLTTFVSQRCHAERRVARIVPYDFQSEEQWWKHHAQQTKKKGICCCCTLHFHPRNTHPPIAGHYF